MVKVKICGLRREGDALLLNGMEAAAGMLPAYAGLVFAPGRRQVTAEMAAKIRAALHPGIQTVGVFVNAPAGEVAALCQSGTLGLVQLHGDEDGAYIQALRAAVGVPIIKAVPVGDSLPPIPQGADYILFDTLSPARGGTGKSFNWALLRGYTGPPAFLAGGLNEGNVQEAIRSFTPYCVDTSSGVERDGRKDAGRIQRFIQAVREATV